MSQKEKKEKKRAISFYKKDKLDCPYCRKAFKREELLSGGGRMVAGDLTDELHRIYEPTPRFGKVYPLLYAVGACPYCHAAFLWNDFYTEPEKKAVRAINHSEADRKKAVKTIFPFYNLEEPRTLYDGAAMYYLALLSYENMSAQYSPTIKKAVVSLRLAWLTKYLDKETPNRGFEYISQRFYRKALFFYEEAVLFETDGKETIIGIGNFGPDVDKNYGYDGVIYLCGLLEYKFGQRENRNERLKKLDADKRAIARVFGLGKSSKSKPGPLLEHSRNLYDNISAELKDASTIDFDLEDN
ncbi:MAG TPA: DUF2225 domain-containing protein [Treponemataceae bacterium]|nr:DUF2225 domain-containing protein [Treponemataceae bacterium]